MSAALEVENATPRSLGYRMPAEWEPHTATWIAWPHNASDWPGRFQPIPWVYAEIVRQLAAVEQVHILVQSVDAEKRARIARYWRPARHDMYAVTAVEAKPSISEPEKEGSAQT